MIIPRSRKNQLGETTTTHTKYEQEAGGERKESSSQKKLFFAICYIGYMLYGAAHSLCNSSA